MLFPIEALLFLFLLAVAGVVIHLRNLFAAAMLTGAFSLLSAGLFTLMDAVDVAFTEAAVGAGFSTVLFLGTLSLTTTEERARPFRLLPLLVVVLTGAALVYGTMDMPGYGSPEAPVHQHLVEDFIEGTQKNIGIPNIVTAILASYRGYDTFGETVVVFTAGLAVLLLLGDRRRQSKKRKRAMP